MSKGIYDTAAGKVLAAPPRGRLPQRSITMYDKLRAVSDMNRLDLHEAVALAEYAKTLLGAFSARKITAPEWLSDTSANLELEIKSRVRDATIKRKRELEQKLDGLQTTAEKRAKLEAELAEVSAALA